jgi:hypothetical protein
MGKGPTQVPAACGPILFRVIITSYMCITIGRELTEMEGAGARRLEKMDMGRGLKNNAIVIVKSTSNTDMSSTVGVVIVGSRNGCGRMSGRERKMIGIVTDGTAMDGRATARRTRMR